MGPSWPDVDFYQFSAKADNTVDVSVSNALLSSAGSVQCRQIIDWKATYCL